MCACRTALLCGDGIGRSRLRALCQGRGMAGPVLHPSLTPDPAAIRPIHTHPCGSPPVTGLGQLVTAGPVPV